MSTTKTQTANLYAKKTFGVLTDPANQPIATVDFQAESTFGLPSAITWEGRLFFNEQLAGFGPVVIAYYELHPVAVSATPVAAT